MECVRTQTATGSIRGKHRRVNGRVTYWIRIEEGYVRTGKEFGDIVLLPFDSLEVLEQEPRPGQLGAMITGEKVRFVVFDPECHQGRKVCLVIGVNIDCQYEDLYSPRDEGNPDIWALRDLWRERARMEASRANRNGGRS